MVGMSRWKRAFIALVVAGFVAGCAGADEKFDTVSNEIDGAATATSPGVDDIDLGGGDALETADEGDGGGSDDGESGEPSDPADPVGGSPLTSSGRQFISTAELGVEVEDVGAASRRAVTIVEGKGGALFGGSSSFRDQPEAVLTLKVPPQDFASTLTQLGDLGTVVSQTVDTQDVTERVVDLESRIQTSSASVDRLQGFLGGATSVADVAAFESELVKRETDLETLRAQLRTIEGQIDLATIVLTIHEEGEEDAAAGAEDDEEELPGFLDGLSGGWNAFLDFGTVALAVLGAFLPWLPLLLVVVIAARLTRRLGRRPPDPVPAE